MQAEAEGHSTSNMFFGGHSLGGIVLQNYITGHQDNVQAILLYGSWVPDLVGAT